MKNKLVMSDGTEDGDKLAAIRRTASTTPLGAIQHPLDPRM